MVNVKCEDSTGKHLGTYNLEATEPLVNLMVLLAAEHDLGEGDQLIRIKNKAAAPSYNVSQAATITLQEMDMTDDEDENEKEYTVVVDSRSRNAQRLLELFGTPTQAPQHQQQQQQVPASMYVEESDVEVQKKLYKAIQQRNIDENLANAMEYTPESFGAVVMLYVDCVINGVPVKAFVDSGAQMSIMNVRTAERCGLLRLLDTRMRGIAVGVGTQAILGRIHMAPIVLNGLHIPFSFSVLERQKMDVIIGLDQLKRHQMMIDLKANCLRIDETVVPFLVEADLPDYAKPGYENAEVEAEEEEEEKIRSELEGASSASPATRTATAGGGATEASDESSKAAAVAKPASDQQQAQQQQQRQQHHSDPMQDTKLDKFMELTGITDAALAKEMLEAAGGNVEVAVSLFFSDS